MSINILLADDSITIQKVIGIIFGGEEYSLTIVDNGTAVLDKARQTDPDILLIDALMPGMSGYEVCELIRATPALSKKPILLLTGSFEPFDEDKASSCGADAFIAKPFESQQIITKVKELCELGAARSIPPHQISELPAAEHEPAMSLEFQVTATSQPQTSALDDIWGAFTAAPETTELQPPPLPAEPIMPEPDVFDLINEEPEPLHIPAPAPTHRAPDSIPAQWTSVDESLFEFTDESAKMPLNADPISTLSIEETNFGDISFEGQQETADTSFPQEPAKAATQEEPLAIPPADGFDVFDEAPIPAFEDPVPAASFIESEPVFIPEKQEEPLLSQPVIDNSSQIAPTTAPLTEEQIKAVIAGLSKDVIERIVWEVVPDLAETLIMEAIRKIEEKR